MNRKHDRKTGLVKVWKAIEEKTISIYLFLILSILPLYFHDFYFDITEAKYHFVKNTTMICGIVYLVFHDISSEQMKKITCTKPFLFYGCFLIFGAVSVLFSKYPSEAFFGNAGRYKGWFIYLIYGIALAMIALEGKVQIKLISLMELSSILCGILAILNHYHIDVFGFYEELRQDQHFQFTSTFGNIGIFGEYISVMLVMSGVLFCIARKNRYYFLLHLITYEICLAALLVNNVDGAFLCVILFFLCFPLILKGMEELQGYLLLLIGFAGTVIVFAVLGKVLPNEKPLNGICLTLRNRSPEFTAILFLFLILFCILRINSGKKQWNFQI